ncbi:MAG: hypothetical protein IKJ07_07960 [Clostridia bacterium]|nr:hypothetical protein [Clostridia bacterium]
MIKFESIHSSGVSLNVLTIIAEYYIPNKPYDPDWVVLPVASFDAYFNSANFNHKWLVKIPRCHFDMRKAELWGL